MKYRLKKTETVIVSVKTMLSNLGRLGKGELPKTIPVEIDVVKVL